MFHSAVDIAFVIRHQIFQFVHVSGVKILPVLYHISRFVIPGFLLLGGRQVKQLQGEIVQLLVHCVELILNTLHFCDDRRDSRLRRVFQNTDHLQERNATGHGRAKSADALHYGLETFQRLGIL